MGTIERGVKRRPFLAWTIHEAPGCNAASDPDIAKNVRLERDGHGEDRTLAYRTRRDPWGLERTVVVTFNPKAAASKATRCQEPRHAQGDSPRVPPQLSRIATTLASSRQDPGTLPEGLR